MQAIEAIVDESGKVELLKPIKLAGTRRAIVTILDEQPAPTYTKAELEAGYKQQARDEARAAKTSKSDVPRKPRAGWAKAARAMAQRGDDELIDAPAPTTWDETEWEW